MALLMNVRKIAANLTKLPRAPKMALQMNVRKTAENLTKLPKAPKMALLMNVRKIAANLTKLPKALKWPFKPCPKNSGKSDDPSRGAKYGLSGQMAYLTEYISNCMINIISCMGGACWQCLRKNEPINPGWSNPRRQIHPRPLFRSESNTDFL
jgi:hypothetical protein